MNKYDNPRDYILYLLGRKDYSKGELLNKAKLKNYDETETQKAITEFIEKKYIDDDRYCENLIYQFSGQKGPNWIKQKLAQKRLPREIIEKYINQINSKPDDSIKQKAMQKYKIKNFNEVDYPTKAKVIAFISRLGYPNSFQIYETWEKESSNSG